MSHDHDNENIPSRIVHFDVVFSAKNFFKEGE